MNLTALFDKFLPHIERTRKPKTATEYARLVNTLILPRLGERDIAALTLDEIETWHTSLPGKVQANRALAVLSAALSYAVDRRLLVSNPARGVHRNKETAREFFYTPEHCKAILQALDGWNDIRAKALVLLLLTGARPAEILSAQPSWRTGSVLRLPDSKTGARTVYLSDAACAVLDSLPARPDGRYFPAGLDLRRAWEKTIKLAGVPAGRLYDLRHSFASAALAAGVSLAVIGQMLGHRKASTTLRYAHLSTDIGLEGAAKAAERMGI